MSDITKRVTDLSPEKRNLFARVIKQRERSRAQKSDRTPASAGAVPNRVPPLIPRPVKGDTPLSFAQESLWFMAQMADNRGVYNLPAAVRLTGALDIAALKRAFVALARRHDILRTVFPHTQGRARQHVLDHPSVDFTVTDIPDVSGHSASVSIDDEGDGVFTRAVAFASSAGNEPFTL